MRERWAFVAKDGWTVAVRARRKRRVRAGSRRRGIRFAFHLADGVLRESEGDGDRTGRGGTDSDETRTREGNIDGSSDGEGESSGEIWIRRREPRFDRAVRRCSWGGDRDRRQQ